MSQLLIILSAIKRATYRNKRPGIRSISKGYIPTCMYCSQFGRGADQLVFYEVLR